MPTTALMMACIVGARSFGKEIRPHWKCLAQGLRNDGNGSYRGLFDRQRPALIPTTPPWTAQGQDTHGSGGDGTVSTDSGRMPGRRGVKASFRHGGKSYGQYNQAKGYEHADSYVDERAQWAAIFGVIKIAQLADWHPSDKART